MSGGYLGEGDWKLTLFAVGSKPSMAAETSAGDCVTSTPILTPTFLEDRHTQLIGNKHCGHGIQHGKYKTLYRDSKSVFLLH